MIVTIYFKEPITFRDVNYNYGGNPRMQISGIKAKYMSSGITLEVSSLYYSSKRLFFPNEVIAYVVEEN